MPACNLADTAAAAAAQQRWIVAMGITTSLAAAFVFLPSLRAVLDATLLRSAPDLQGHALFSLALGLALVLMYRQVHATHAAAVILLRCWGECVQRVSSAALLCSPEPQTPTHACGIPAPGPVTMAAASSADWEQPASQHRTQHVLPSAKHAQPQLVIPPGILDQCSPPLSWAPQLRHPAPAGQDAIAPSSEIAASAQPPHGLLPPPGTTTPPPSVHQQPAAYRPAASAWSSTDDGACRPHDLPGLGIRTRPDEQRVCLPNSRASSDLPRCTAGACLRDLGPAMRPVAHCLAPALSATCWLGHALAGVGDRGDNTEQDGGDGEPGQAPAAMGDKEDELGSRLDPCPRYASPHGRRLTAAVKINTTHSVADLPPDLHARLDAMLERIAAERGMPRLSLLRVTARNGCVQLVLELRQLGGQGSVHQLDAELRDAINAELMATLGFAHSGEQQPLGPDATRADVVLFQLMTRKTRNQTQDMAAGSMDGGSISEDPDADGGSEASGPREAAQQTCDATFGMLPPSLPCELSAASGGSSELVQLSVHVPVLHDAGWAVEGHTLLAPGLHHIMAEPAAGTRVPVLQVLAHLSGNYCTTLVERMAGVDGAAATSCVYKVTLLARPQWVSQHLRQPLSLELWHQGRLEDTAVALLLPQHSAGQVSVASVLRGQPRPLQAGTAELLAGLNSTPASSEEQPAHPAIRRPPPDYTDFMVDLGIWFEAVGQQAGSAALGPQQLHLGHSLLRYAVRHGLFAIADDIVEGLQRAAAGHVLEHTQWQQLLLCAQHSGSPQTQEAVWSWQPLVGPPPLAQQVATAPQLSPSLDLAADPPATAVAATSELRRRANPRLQGLLQVALVDSEQQPCPHAAAPGPATSDVGAYPGPLAAHSGVLPSTTAGAQATTAAAAPPLGVPAVQPAAAPGGVHSSAVMPHVCSAANLPAPGESGRALLLSVLFGFQTADQEQAYAAFAYTKTRVYLLRWLPIAAALMLNQIMHASSRFMAAAWLLSNVVMPLSGLWLVRAWPWHRCSPLASHPDGNPLQQAASSAGSTAATAAVQGPHRATPRQLPGSPRATAVARPAQPGRGSEALWCPRHWQGVERTAVVLPVSVLAVSVAALCSGSDVAMPAKLRMGFASKMPYILSIGHAIGFQARLPASLVRALLVALYSAHFSTVALEGAPWRLSDSLQTVLPSLLTLGVTIALDLQLRRRFLQPK